MSKVELLSCDQGIFMKFFGFRQCIDLYSLLSTVNYLLKNGKTFTGILLRSGFVRKEMMLMLLVLKIV